MSKSEPKLTNEQRRVLRAAAEGRLTRLHHMGWFQKGGYEIRGERSARESTIDKLLSMSLIRSDRAGFGNTATPMVATESGQRIAAPEEET